MREAPAAAPPFSYLSPLEEKELGRPDSIDAPGWHGAAILWLASKPVKVASLAAVGAPAARQSG